MEEGISEYHKKFLARARRFAEALARGQPSPPDFLLREKEALLDPYREQLKILEESKKAAIARMDEEINQLKTTITRLEKEIAVERDRLGRLATEAERKAREEEKGKQESAQAKPVDTEEEIVERSDRAGPRPPKRVFPAARLTGTDVKIDRTGAKGRTSIEQEETEETSLGQEPQPARPAKKTPAAKKARQPTKPAGGRRKSTAKPAGKPKGEVQDE